MFIYVLLGLGEFVYFSILDLSFLAEFFGVSVFDACCCFGICCVCLFVFAPWGLVVLDCVCELLFGSDCIVLKIGF